MDNTYLLPSFLRKLSDPAIQTVFVCGCGGGFDFVHSMTLYPELKRLNKKVIIGSYSFGDPSLIANATVEFQEGGLLVKKVTAASKSDWHYGPEVGMCKFLDEEYPLDAPHSIYAYYARAWTIPSLTKLYQKFISDHNIDAVVMYDGGSDSLMAGDEAGLGDPIEDAVSVGTVAGLKGLKLKVLISVGLGSDRYIDVSDAASLRAIAELTAMGGFLGSVSIEQDSPGFKCYQKCVEKIYEGQQFRSVLTGVILSASKGKFGFVVPDNVGARVAQGQSYLWPLQAMLWTFDIEKVAKRSFLIKEIQECNSQNDCYMALDRLRKKLGAQGKLRTVEDFPLQTESFHH